MAVLHFRKIDGRQNLRAKAQIDHRHFQPGIE